MKAHPMSDLVKITSVLLGINNHKEIKRFNMYDIYLWRYYFVVVTTKELKELTINLFKITCLCSCVTRQKEGSTYEFIHHSTFGMLSFLRIPQF